MTSKENNGIEKGWNVLNSLKLDNDLKNLKDTVEQMIEYYKYLGKMTKAYYDGLIESGFTKEEALKIVSAKSLKQIGMAE